MGHNMSGAELKGLIMGMCAQRFIHSDSNLCWPVIDNAAFLAIPTNAPRVLEKRLSIMLTRLTERSTDSCVASVVFHDDNQTSGYS
jgi:hypothetical protein